MNWPWQQTRHDNLTGLTTERAASVAKIHIDGWSQDWGLVVAAIQKGTGLSRLEVLAYLCLNELGIMRDAMYRNGEKLTPLIDETIKQMRDGQEGEDWKPE